MRPLTKTGFYISKKIGKAIADYNLIEDKDRILVAVSGGKDSFALLELLNERKKWAPVNYELIAFHVEADYGCSSAAQTRKLKNFFEEKGISYRVKKIRIAKSKSKKSPCFWCSWNRRKALFAAADKLHCNKVALGHHKDDIIETLLLNIFYQGEFSAMNPRQELFKGKVVLIRPLCYVEEHSLTRFAKEMRFSTTLHKCPSAETTKRRLMKGIINKIEKECPHVKKNIFSSMARVNKEYIQIMEEK